MQQCDSRPDLGSSAVSTVVADAISAWHRGDVLSQEQRRVIDAAMSDTYARALLSVPASVAG